MIAPSAIDGAAHRITHQARLHGGDLDPCVYLEPRVEGRFRFPVFHQFDALEQSASPDITDIRVLPEGLVQPVRQIGPMLPDVPNQPFFPDHLLDRQRSGTGGWMPHIGVPVHQGSGPRPDSFVDLAGDEERPDRLIAGAEPFGDCDHVRRDPVELTGISESSAAHTTHDLVQDQQNAMAVANLTNPPEIALSRRNRAQVAPTTGSAMNAATALGPNA